jgi:hypothetical protein
MAVARAYWVHDILGEGDEAVRAMFRVASTTVPGHPLEDAGWEDDEEHHRSAADLVDAFRNTWQLIADCLGRWSTEDLAVEFTRGRGDRTQTFTRAGSSGTSWSTRCSTARRSP